MSTDWVKTSYLAVEFGAERDFVTIVDEFLQNYPYSHVDVPGNLAIIVHRVEMRWLLPILQSRSIAHQLREMRPISELSLEEHIALRRRGWISTQLFDSLRVTKK